MSESEAETTEDESTEDLPTEEDIQAAIENADDDDGGMGGMMDFMSGGGVEQMLLAEQYGDPQTGHTYSLAALIADVINVMRMDTKQMAALHDIDVEVNKMSPERAAELLSQVATQNGLSLIQVFENIEDQRDLILQQKMNEEQHAQYMAFKRQMLYSYGGE